MKPMNMERVAKFCDWLCTIPPTPPFHTHPEFRFFKDLTDAEIDAASAEMQRRGEAAEREAKSLRAERAARAEPDTRSFRGNFLLFRQKSKGLRRRTGGETPRFRHPTFDSAETEAKRLLGLFPESTFVIIQEVARVKLKPVGETAHG